MDTLADMFLEVQREIGDQGSIFVNSDDVIRWANAGVVEIIRKAELDNYVQSVIPIALGDSSLTISAGSILNIEFIRIGTKVLTEATFTELESLHPGFDLDNDEGEPQYYWVTDNSGEISFYPKADAVYNALCRASILPPAYTLTTDLLTVGIPDSYKYDLLRFVMMRANNRRQDHQSAEAAKEEFNNNIAMRYGEANSKSAEFDTIQPDEWDTPYLVAGYYGDL